MNRTRFRESDKGVVEVHPQRADLVPKRSSGTDISGDVDVERDLPEVSVFGCDGFGCRSDPRYRTFIETEGHTCQLCCV